MLAIKERLDTNNERGQFLLAGSANILTLPRLPMRCPGEWTMYGCGPFRRESWTDGARASSTVSSPARLPRIDGAEVGRGAYAARIVAGGFPDAQERSPRGRARFFDSYVSTLLGRDLQDIATVRDTHTVRRLLRILAARSAGLLSVRSVAGELGVDHKTVASQARILEELFLVGGLQPWHVNLGSRRGEDAKDYMVERGC